MTDCNWIQLIITVAATLVAAFGASYLTNYLNNKARKKEHEYDYEQRLIRDIKIFAQQCFNIANENKCSISQHEFIRLTRTLEEYQSYFRVLHLSEYEVSNRESLKNLQSIVKNYRNDYRKALINQQQQLDILDSKMMSNGFNYILQKLEEINH